MGGEGGGAVVGKEGRPLCPLVGVGAIAVGWAMRRGLALLSNEATLS